MIISLPKPPSVNHLYGTTAKGGFVHRYITKEGRDWFLKNGTSLYKQLKLTTPITHKVTLTIVLYTAKGQDVDNIGKCILDLLQRCFYCFKNNCGHRFRSLENDKLVYDYRVYKVDVHHLPEEHVELKILPLSEDSKNPFSEELLVQSSVSEVKA